MIWLTADHHFGHANIIKHCNRPFASVREMDQALIVHWNAVVGKNDTVWHLGDFAFKGLHPREYLARLNGKINILHGNHDNLQYLEQCRQWGMIEWHGPVREIKWEKKKFWLSHYAHRTWPASHHGAFHLYGHSHGNLPSVGRSMDVGVDNFNFYPVSIDAVVKTLEPKEMA